MGGGEDDDPLDGEALEQGVGVSGHGPGVSVTRVRHYQACWRGVSPLSPSLGKELSSGQGFQ